MDQNKNIAFQGKSEYHAFGPFWGSRLVLRIWQPNNTEAVYVIPLFGSFQTQHDKENYQIDTE